MDVPFLSSSAVNREHYHLVQSVEAALTPQQIDAILAHKVHVIRNRFARRVPSNADCFASLIILLYCFTTSSGNITRASLEFALPHAVTLAESGSSLKEKRIGYLFCTEMMKETDELQLMLVNTIRKDISNSDPKRICLALDILIANCPADAMPAITHHLFDLVAHTSPNVKRKTMMLIRTAGKRDPELLMNVRDKVLLRLNDHNANVVSAALLLLEEVTRADIIEPRRAMEMLTAGRFNPQSLRERNLRQLFVQVVGSLASQLSTADYENDRIRGVIDTIFNLLAKVVVTEHALILECFKTISRFPTNILHPYFISDTSHPLAIIRKLLGSRKPNTQYLCLECLLHLDPVLWAGVESDLSMAFDELEVNTIMTYLDSPDKTIRVKTLQVLSRVERTILLMHMTQLLSSPPNANEVELAQRALEVAAVYEQDGRAYASRLSEICGRLSSHEKASGKEKAGFSGARLVAESVVEQILLHLGRVNDAYCGEFVDGVIAIPPAEAGPTFSLVITAAVCEHGGLSSVSQEALLDNLAKRLKTNPPAIQEALLLSMLRTLARHGSSVAEVTTQVKELHQVSRSHIQRRCIQYLTFSSDLHPLHDIVRRARSSTLPDFLVALETPAGEIESSRGSEATVSPTGRVNIQRRLSTTSPPGKLRYEAYEAPKIGPKLMRRRNSNRSIDSSSSLGSHSTKSVRGSASSPRDINNPQDVWASHVKEDEEEPLSRTLTAGDLAMAAHDPQFMKVVSNPTSMPEASRSSDPIQGLIS
ncbi:hypothetical protein M422DRAFT_780350 [Sphaerobolus stellatus SS14]|uniref:Clathrin/coatomer adaptor adaptin-like N-terminal domain-containing protein n=1 Tax=Sphaerobolus stellatus (strain SS14) TaxID=990650 RepID=A0A0C9VI84_SPHS4|nr:hypothetical protein M422DRAFT_780350 [Sphaerobolus stellatus SS14]